MKIRQHLLVCFIFLHAAVEAQMKIGDNSTSINSASLLELETTNKGLVFPRVSLTSVSSSSPLAATLLTGTVIFNTNASVTNGNGVGLYYWNGSTWSIITPNIASSAWSLTGNANTNSAVNFLGTTDNISLQFRTNNVQRMIIDNSGKVGIGTTTPASDLTLYQGSGSGSSKGFTFTGNSIGGSNSGTGFLMSLGYNATGNKQLWVGDADYAGSVSGSFARFGISGTSFPVLDAVSGNNVSRRYLALGVAGDANSGIIFGSDNTSVNPGSQVWDNGNMTIGSGYKSFAAPSNGLLVQGNVGIGTTNPGYALSVSATNPLYLLGVQATSAFTTDSLLTIYNGLVKEAPFSSLTSNFWGLTGNAGTNAATNFIGTTDAIDFVAKTNNTDRIHILGAANGSSKEGWIGMGVSIPRSSLDVTGNYTNKNVVTIQNTSSSGYSSVDMLDNSGALVGTFGYGNSGTGAFFGSRDYFSFYGHDFVLNTNSGNYNFFVNGTSGNIGINTGSPGAKLDVSGNFKLGSSGTVLTNIYKTSVSITIPASLSSFSVSQTVAVSNAPLNSSVIVNPRSALPSGVGISYSYVSSANNVTINFTGISAVALATPVTFDVTVMY